MSPSTCEFNWGTLKMPVHDATMHHIANLDPQLEWEKKGLKSHEKDSDAAQALDRALAEAQQFLETPEGQQQVQEFLGSAGDIFRELAVDHSGIENHFPDTEFLFILGPMRTGGTYLLNESFNMLDLDRRDFNFRMVADSLPRPQHAIMWDDPPYYLSLLFELAQFLQWTRETWPAHTVIKKRTALAHALPLLDDLFGEKARYLITVRHPGGMAESTQEYFQTHDEENDPTEQGWNFLIEDRTGLTREEWEQLDQNERILRYWTTFYTDVGKTDHLAGELTPVVFGRDSESLVNELADEWGVDHEPDAFTPSDRTFDDFWDRSEVTRAINKVETAWNLYDRAWPELPRL